MAAYEYGNTNEPCGRSTAAAADSPTASHSADAHTLSARRYAPRVLLYTCPARTHGANFPVVPHPCGIAAQALERSGHTFTVKTVGGFKNIPLSRRGKRDEIIALTGQPDVPVLVLDDNSVIHGTNAIVEWAAAHSVA